MQIYLTRNGAQEGPFTVEQVQAKVSAGTLTAADLGWYEGCPEWIPLSSIPGLFQATPATAAAIATPALPVDPTVPQIRPWVRYWARTIDISVFSVTAGFVLAIIFPAIVNANDNVLGLALLFLWCFVEPIFLSTWGTTPGKALLNTRLRNADGTKLAFGSALSRSLNVWVRGWGLGIPLVSLITLCIAHRTLTTNGVTTWDQNGNYHVTHGKVGAIRIIAVILFFIAFIFLIALGEAGSHAN